jgi:hypothetical protein
MKFPDSSVTKITFIVTSGSNKARKKYYTLIKSAKVSRDGILNIMIADPTKTGFIINKVNENNF